MALSTGAGKGDMRLLVEGEKLRCESEGEGGMDIDSVSLIEPAAKSGVRGGVCEEMRWGAEVWVGPVDGMPPIGVAIT